MVKLPTGSHHFVAHISKTVSSPLSPARRRSTHGLCSCVNGGRWHSLHARRDGNGRRAGSESLALGRSTDGVSLVNGRRWHLCGLNRGRVLGQRLWDIGGRSVGARVIAGGRVGDG